MSRVQNSSSTVLWPTCNGHFWTYGERRETSGERFRGSNVHRERSSVLREAGSRQFSKSNCRWERSSVLRATSTQQCSLSNGAGRGARTKSPTGTTDPDSAIRRGEMATFCEDQMMVPNPYIKPGGSRDKNLQAGKGFQFQRVALARGTPS